MAGPCFTSCVLIENITFDIGYPFTPLLNYFRGGSVPFRDFTHDPQRCLAAIGTRRVAGKFFISNIWIIFVAAGWFYDIYPFTSLPLGQSRGQSGTID